MPRMAEMLNMFEPIAFPMDRAAPPETAAVSATVNSGRVVETEIRVKPMEVLPSLVMAAIFVAYFMTMSLAMFRKTKAAAMIMMFTAKLSVKTSAIG
jgi:hypothetical protein